MNTSFIFLTIYLLVLSPTTLPYIGITGIRWYELSRCTDSLSCNNTVKTRPYSIIQQSTLGLDDKIHRWLGSIAMDNSGNIALGYQVVSNIALVYPGIRITGRLKDDPLNLITLKETIVVNGNGIQTSENNRFGDYTSMMLDPDGCTFWYTAEYYSITSDTDWNTKIVSFRLPGCELLSIRPTPSPTSRKPTRRPTERPKRPTKKPKRRPSRRPTRKPKWRPTKWI